MKIGHFYFLTDDYFRKFNDGYLMQNKESIGGKEHGRPCFYVFKFDNSEIFWMIPISSNVKKYLSIYEKKVLKYGICDTIVFGKIFGYDKVFLIQNMCPTTEEYIKEEYFNSDNVPILMTDNFNIQITMKAQKILNMQRNGIKVIIPDVLSIERRLIEELKW